MDLKSSYLSFFGRPAYRSFSFLLATTFLLLTLCDVVYRSASASIPFFAPGRSEIYGAIAIPLAAWARVLYQHRTLRRSLQKQMLTADEDTRTTTVLRAASDMLLNWMCFTSLAIFILVDSLSRNK